jgi:hypothetical protein
MSLIEQSAAHVLPPSMRASQRSANQTQRPSTSSGPRTAVVSIINTAQNWNDLLMAQLC